VILVFLNIKDYSQDVFNSKSFSRVKLEKK